MNTTEYLKSMSPEAFAALGAGDMAYIKAIVVRGKAGFAIHAADGSQMAILDEREVAFAAARQHDMEPLSVH